MESLVWDGALRQEFLHSSVQGIHLNNELAQQVRLTPDQGGGEEPLELREGATCFRGSGEGCRRRTELGKRCHHPAVVSDEGAIDVHKAQEPLELFKGSEFQPLCLCLDLFPDLASPACFL